MRLLPSDSVDCFMSHRLSPVFKPTWRMIMKKMTRILRSGKAALKAWQFRLVAVLGLLALMWACYPVTDATYSNPQDSGTGQWLIEFRTGEEKVHIEMRYERKSEKGNHSNSNGFSIDPGRFYGLTREQAMS